MDYIAYLDKEKKSDFGVSFPDFPGCITAGKTLDEARLMAAEALAMHIASIAEDGKAIPEPSTIDALAGDHAHLALETLPAASPVSCSSCSG